MAKFDVKTEATRVIYAGIGANDVAVAAVRDLVVTAQKSLQRTVAEVQKVATIDLDPRALGQQATTVVSSRVDALAQDAKARRKAIEARVAELQGEALSYPTKVQSRVTDLVGENTEVFGLLVKRGETLVARIRRQQSTVEAAEAAKSTVAKARTTQTQATETAETAARTTRSTARKAVRKTSATTRKKAATTTASAKATTTAAKKTASRTAKAVAEAAEKVGD